VVAGAHRLGGDDIIGSLRKIGLAPFRTVKINPSRNHTVPADIAGHLAAVDAELDPVTLRAIPGGGFAVNPGAAGRTADEDTRIIQVSSSGKTLCAPIAELLACQRPG